MTGVISTQLIADYQFTDGTTLQARAVRGAGGVPDSHGQGDLRGLRRDTRRQVSPSLSRTLYDPKLGRDHYYAKEIHQMFIIRQSFIITSSSRTH